MNKPIKERLVDLVQGSDEWRAFRRFKIGASRAPAICGVSPWQTPLQLYDEIISGKEGFTNAAMQRGKDLEAEARAKLNELTGFNFQPAIVMHPSLDWHYSSLDGLTTDDEIILVCEIKCPGFEDHETAILGEVPYKYMPQCLHILEDVPEARCLIYASYYRGNLVIVNVDRDVDAMAVQLVKERVFYEAVNSLEEPEATDKDWVVMADEETTSLSARFEEASKAYEAAREVVDALRVDVLKKVGLNARTRLGSMKVHKVLRKGAIDYSKIEILRGYDLEPYRKAGVITWRLTV